MYSAKLIRQSKYEPKEEEEVDHISKKDKMQKNKKAHSIHHYSAVISAVQSLRMSRSVSDSVLLINRPFSLARCSRLMKQ